MGLTDMKFCDIISMVDKNEMPDGSRFISIGLAKDVIVEYKNNKLVFEGFEFKENTLFEELAPMNIYDYENSDENLYSVICYSDHIYHSIKYKFKQYGEFTRILSNDLKGTKFCLIEQSDKEIWIREGDYLLVDEDFNFSKCTEFGLRRNYRKV